MVVVEFLKSDVQLFLVELDLAGKSVDFLSHRIDTQERDCLLYMSAKIQVVDVGFLSQELSGDIEVIHQVVVHPFKVERSLCVLLMHVNQEPISVQLLFIFAQLTRMVGISALHKHKILKGLSFR